MEAHELHALLQTARMGVFTLVHEAKVHASCTLSPCLLLCSKVYPPITLLSKVNIQLLPRNVCRQRRRHFIGRSAPISSFLNSNSTTETSMSSAFSLELHVIPEATPTA